MELTKREVLEMFQAMSQLKELKVGNIRFLYSLTKNFRIISAEAESIQAGISPPLEVVRFERERIEFVNSVALKDKEGNIVWMIPGQEPFIEQTEEVAKAVQEFFSSHQEDLKATEDFNRKAEEFLAEKVSLDLVPFKLSELPEDTINFNIMNVLYPIIEE